MIASTDSSNAGASASIVKAAKKALKKNGDSMKLNDLAKAVAEKKGIDGEHSFDTVLETIRGETKKFSVVGGDSSNIVQLNSKKKGSKKGKKRSSSTNDEENKTGKKAKVGKNDSTDDDVAAWRKENKIILAATSAGLSSDELNRTERFLPMRTFSSATAGGGVASSLVRHCTDASGFERPSPIQSQAWPILLAERDVVGIAETGSGKTLAFSLPALTRMMADKTAKNHRQPRMLVLAPTRELAMQTDKVLQEFGAVVAIRSIVLYGGVPKHAQVSQLQRGGIDVVVATPGRLKDLIEMRSVRLDAVQYLVLDEADRMLDMGFEEDVRFIISECKSTKDGRQTAMFSATWPAAIQDIAATYMTDPIRVYVGFEAVTNRGDGEDGGDGDGDGGPAMVDDSLSANKNVEQNVEVLDDNQRPSRLRDLLRKVHTQDRRNDRVLVFALYKKEVERLEQSLRRDGWNCCSIHGNKNQGARTQALEQFKDGTCPLLIATDVAARGLDIPNVEAVINYTFPLTTEDYVHRIGRTGRAGKTGVSYTFFQPGDKARAGELQQVMRQAGQEVPEALLKFGSTIKKKEHKLYGSFGPNNSQPMKKATKITFNYSDDEGE